jgi:DNA polymerase-4
MQSTSDEYSLKKIIHVDMDAFYASVEQREQPDLIGRPVIVAWPSKRSVVCAASYEARSFGIHSAMPASRAKKLCPDGVFVPPQFDLYRQISNEVKSVYRKYTDLIEPLSLDEAYLDVTRNKPEIPSATEIAQRIKTEIKQVTDLNASAGVGPNKFIAKIASDWNKPNGICVVKPKEVLNFISTLPVRKIPGIGPATEISLKNKNIRIVSELACISEVQLVNWYGKFGKRLFNLARGIDLSPVNNNRIRKSLSFETTFEQDKTLAEIEPELLPLTEKIWNQLGAKNLQANTFYLKLKTHDFKNTTRSKTSPKPVRSLHELIMLVQHLLYKSRLPKTLRYRLIGIGASNFVQPNASGDQPRLL